MTPVIGHLSLLPSEYHSLHGRSQPTNCEFPANSINTAPNLFLTLPFEKKTLAARKQSRYFIPYKAPKPWQTSQKSPINEKKREKPRLRGFQVLLFHGWHPIVLRSGRIELWQFVVYTNNPLWRQQTSDIQHSALRKGVDFQNLSQQFHVSMDKDTLFKTSTYSTSKIINCSSNSGAHLLAYEIGFELGLFQLKLPKLPESIFYPSTFQGIGFYWLKARHASHIQKNEDFGNHHGHSAHVAFSWKGFPIMLAKFHNPFKIAFLSVIFGSTPPIQ